MSKRFDKKDWYDDLKKAMDAKKINPSTYSAMITPDDAKLYWRRQQSVYDDYIRMMQDQMYAQIKAQSITSIYGNTIFGTWQDDSAYTPKSYQCPESKVTVPENIIPGDGRMVGYIEAYRAWKLNLSKGRLTSDSFDEVIWEPRKPVKASGSKCMFNTSKGIGIYAAKERDLILKDYEPRDKTIFIIGKVALWGAIKEHEKGYRAEWAYPLEFLKITNVAPELEFTLLRALSDIYLPRR